MGRSILKFLKITAPTLLVAERVIDCDKIPISLKRWVTFFWWCAVLLLTLQVIRDASMQFVVSPLWSNWQKVCADNIWPTLFCFIPLSRCNEICLVFLEDAFDKLPNRTGKIKRPRKEIGLKARVDYALLSFSELIMNFAILYSVLPVGSWKIGGEEVSLGVLDSLYYSVVTITTLGYGDITPFSFFSKILSMYEVIAGIVLIVFSLAVYMTYAGYLISQEQTLSFKTKNIAYIADTLKNKDN